MRPPRPAAEATAGEAMDPDGLSTAVGAAAPPGAAMQRPAAEAHLKGAEYDAETEDMVESLEAAAAAGVRSPRPSNRGAPTKKQKENWNHGAHPTRRFTFGPHGTPAAAGAARAAEDWQFGNASAEAAMTAASGAAEDGPGVPLATGPAAEVLYEGAECDVDMGNGPRPK